MEEYWNWMVDDVVDRLNFDDVGGDDDDGFDWRNGCGRCSAESPALPSNSPC
jgi:hypothetical protein